MSNPDDLKVLIYRLLNDLEADLDNQIYNRFIIIWRDRDADPAQLAQLRDLLIQRAYFKYIYKRFISVIQWFDLL